MMLALSCAQEERLVQGVPYNGRTNFIRPI